MVYVTSDLHGIPLPSLQALLDKAGFGEDDFLFVLGDVIDRGQHGAQLLLWLSQQSNVQLILGNHEAILLACDFLFRDVTEENLDALTLENIQLLQTWMDNGGKPTLDGLQRLLKQDPELLEGILDLLRDAPWYEVLRVRGKKFILTHAGLGNFQPAKDLDDYTLEELTMDRPRLEENYFSDAMVVFGHTPTEVYSMSNAGRSLGTATWIDIDTGAAGGGMPMLLRLDDMAEFYV